MCYLPDDDLQAEQEERRHGAVEREAEDALHGHLADSMALVCVCVCVCGCFCYCLIVF